jgi:hypothetical protein
MSTLPDADGAPALVPVGSHSVSRWVERIQEGVMHLFQSS